MAVHLTGPRAAGVRASRARDWSLVLLNPAAAPYTPFPGTFPGGYIPVSLLRIHPCIRRPRKGGIRHHGLDLGRGLLAHVWHGATRAASPPWRIIRFRAECSARIGVDCTGMCNRGKTVQDVLFAGPAVRAGCEGSRRRRPRNHSPGRTGGPGGGVSSEGRSRARLALTGRRAA